MIYSKILGVGAYVPPRIVTNTDLSRMMDTSDEWIQQRTGIKQRHWVEGTTTTSDLALAACNDVLAKTGVKKDEIDMLIMATLSPDHEFPGTACFLQAKLGVPGIPALDVRQQCSGFIYSMAIADSFIRTGTKKRILIVGAEIHSKGLDKSTQGRDLAVLFGDGAGAMILEASSENELGSRLISTHLHADGTFAKELWIEFPSMTLNQEIDQTCARFNDQAIAEGRLFPKMNGKTVFMHASRRMPEVVNEALVHNRIKIEDIDLFVFHQANLRINEMVAKQLGIPENKVFNTIDRFGNTTAATIPLGLAEAVKAGVLKKGMLVMSAAFGSGFTWGSAVYRW